MKKIAIGLVMVLFITSGWILADQLPKPTLNIKNDVQSTTFVRKTDPGYRSDLLFDQPPSPADPVNLGSAQWDSLMGLDSRIADNFTVPYMANIDSVVWWGGYWNYGPDTNPVLDFWVEIFPDSTGSNQPKQDPVYSERVPFDAVFLGNYATFDYYRYSAVIPLFAANVGETYWLAIRATLIYQPQYGWEMDTFPDIGDGQVGFFKSDYFGFPEWVTTTTIFGAPYEVPFQIYGMPYGVEEGHTTVPSTGDIVFNSITSSKIRFKIALPIPTNVKAQIFDLTGRMVGTILDSELPAGENVCEHDVELPTGVYFVNVKAGEVTKMGKILVVR